MQTDGNFFDQPFLTNQDSVDLVNWRRFLHSNPEISGQEKMTAKAVVEQLALSAPDKVISELGGHGVAAVYEGEQSGPTVLIRSELDALPIEQSSDKPYRSTIPGKAHLCGHDGHTTMLAALAKGLGRQRPKSGRVVLMFQPAEETGAGAKAVIEDPRFAEIQPDFSFSLHNTPGVALGSVVLEEGPANCASRGMQIDFEGTTAHAAQPETGTSPMQAISELMPALSQLGGGSIAGHDLTMITVTHVLMGEPTYGIAPSDARLFVTLRSVTDGQMDGLVEQANDLISTVAEREGLSFKTSFCDVFSSCENNPEAVAHLKEALEAEQVPLAKAPMPRRASEDFGRFGHHSKSAMFYLGSGEGHPELHTPEYDFPDDLIPIGANVFMRVIRNMLG